MNIVLMGVQGSGKGTQAEMLAEARGYEHINIGQLFRSEIAADSEIGRLAAIYINKGELVPDDVTYQVLDKDAPQGSRDMIFDGFPRSLPQAEYIYKHYKIKMIIILDLEIAESLRRITARRHCSNCGKGYNILFKKPAVEGVCDVCGGKLITRDDDKPKEVMRRIEIYKGQVKKLLSYFEGKVPVFHIDASAGIKEVFAEILNTVDGKPQAG